MGKFGIWHINDNKPVRVDSGSISLEKHLENWIESDPAMLPGNLEIVARQMILEGGRLDLLGIDPLGRWVVVELKAGEVNLSTFTQALYYAAQIDQMSFDILESKINAYLGSTGKTITDVLRARGLVPDDQARGKELLLYLVGTKKSRGMENLMEYIGSRTNFSTTIIVFEVFNIEEGKPILVREMTEQEVTPHATAPLQSTMREVNDLLALGEREGIGIELRKLHQASEKLGFYARPYKHAIMYTSPKNKSRMLFTVIVDKNPMQVYWGPETFADYYPVDEENLRSFFGEPGWKNYDAQSIDAAIDYLFSLGINENTEPQS